MIQIEGLTRRFGDRVAVEDLTLDVQPGEIFGLLGPNGAGKTTTLRMLAGLISPSSGRAAVDGIPLEKKRLDEVRGRVGFLTEAPGLWDRLSVRTNLQVYAELYGVPQPAAAVDRSLELFGLAERADSAAAQLSKGMKQKLALARALIHQPPIVLLDEPTSGLDPLTSRMVREMVLELRDRGHTIVISTHNLDEAERVCSRIAVLQRRLIALDTPEALRRRLFGQRVTFRFSGNGARFGDVLRRAGARDAQPTPDGLSVAVGDLAADTPPLVAALVNAGAALTAVIPEAPPLEDVYLKLISEREPGESEV